MTTRPSLWVHRFMGAAAKVDAPMVLGDVRRRYALEIKNRGVAHLCYL
jgi:hypothetical protein